MGDLILGLDEAGKGPVIGPMILAGCLIEKETEKEFRKLGVKDSKKVTPKRRGILDKEIKKLSKKFSLAVCYPKEIDETNSKGIKLTELEANHVAKIINKLNPGNGIRVKVISDCPSVGIAKWKELLKTKIKNQSNLDLVIEHKADKNHLAVSAASVLAKTRRELEMDKIKKEYGNGVGSGYCADPLTCKFLEKYVEKHKNKGIFRRSWITWKNASLKLKQQKLNF